MQKQSPAVEWLYNPDLPFIRPDWLGNPFINGRFYNNPVKETIPLKYVLRWQFSPNPQRREKRQEEYSVPVSPELPDLKGEDKLIWLGHSAFFIRLNGVNILTDPCLFNIYSIRRHVGLPFPADYLRHIDYILISHDHRDHLQLEALKILVRNNPDVQILMPLKGARLLKGKALRSVSVQEAGWYQRYKTDERVSVVFLPAKHWGRRFLTDYNRTLWGSFHIKAGNKTLYFGGDTAFSSVFTDIQNVMGKSSYCLLPISAYAPDYLMGPSHANPEEAYEIFTMLKGERFIPMHYGTYDLSNEPMGEPIRRLKARFAENGMSEKLDIPAVGEVFYL